MYEHCLVTVNTRVCGGKVVTSIRYCITSPTLQVPLCCAAFTLEYNMYL